MSEAQTEDRLGRIEATLASLVPLIHRVDELPSLRLTQFQERNRGNRIPLVSWLDGASEQAAFRQ